MSRLSRLTEERGSVIVFTALILTGLLAVCGLAVDFGSWFTQQRHLQGAADAAALAGAQDLPDTSMAASTAQSYASTNFSGLQSWSPSFPDAGTIDVTLSESAAGTFSKFVGIESKTLHAHARAFIGVPGQMKNVAPVAVKTTAACMTISCFGTPKTLNFDESNLSSSKFGLVSLACQGDTSSQCNTSSIGSSDLVNWVLHGYPDYLSVNKWLAAVNGQKIGPVRDALAQMGAAGTTLLFPVFDTADNTAYSFHIVGWAAFVIDNGGVVSWKNDAPSCRPNCKVLTGHFTRYVAEGIAGTPSITNYGVRTIELSQ